jgi:hypothetical protein
MRTESRPAPLRRRPAVVVLALVAAVVAVLASVAPAGAQPNGGGGATPVPDNPNGRSVTLSPTSVAPGGTVSFTGTGYVNDGGTGQTVTVKLNDVDILGTFEAAASGALSGSVTIPASLEPGEYWLRFLAGAGKPNDMPISSVHATFTLTASTGGGGGGGDGGGGGGGAAAGGSTGGGSTTGATVSATGASGTGTGTSGGTLPNNGFDRNTWMLLGSVLVASGVAVVIGEGVWRRRRSRPTA